MHKSSPIEFWQQLKKYIYICMVTVLYFEINYNFWLIENKISLLVIVVWWQSCTSLRMWKLKEISIFCLCTRGNIFCLWQLQLLIYTRGNILVFFFFFSFLFSLSLSLPLFLNWIACENYCICYLCQGMHDLSIGAATLQEEHEEQINFS